MALNTVTLWNRFRKFRLVVLALASILSLIWAIIIAVYMANNWSSYNSSQRGFFFGLIALDFVGAILLYLMVVVQYQFWPDAARTAVLLGLHVGGAVIFTILNPKFPCTAFGSTASCHKMTITVLSGSWAISALIFAYAIFLPVMAVIPRPRSSTDADDLENPEDTTEVEQDNRKSHASSSSRAWLLKNQEGMSPEMRASELPIPPIMPAARSVRRNTSSPVLLRSPPQAMNDIRVQLETPSTPVHSDSSPRSSVAITIRASDNVNRSVDLSDSLSSGQFLSRSSWRHSRSLPNRFVGEPLDANRVSMLSSSYESTCEYQAEVHRTSSMTTGSSSSAYSQNTLPARAKSTSASQPVRTSASADASQTLPLRSKSLVLPSTNSLGQLSVHSMTASVHSHAEHQSPGDDYVTSSNGFLSPSQLTAPSPRFSVGSNPSGIELQLSDIRSGEYDESDLLGDAEHGLVQDSVPIRPRVQHIRINSTSSNIDLDEWRRLVLSAAGREH